MAFQNGDLIVVNRNGIDYKALIDDLIAGDGDIAFNAGDGLAEVGTNATANQTEDTAKTFSVKTAGGIIIDGNGNVIIDPNFNLGTEEHGIGDGAIAFNAGDGLAEAGTNATANQISDTVKTFSVKTAGGIIIDGSGNVIIDPNYNLGTEEHGVGDGAIAFNAGSGLAETGTNATANQIGDTVKTFNVKTAEGIIIDGNGNVIIDPNFNLGTEEHGVGDGAINVNPGPGLEATGANATANQKGDTTRVLSAKTGSGIIIDGDGAISIDPSFNLDGNITPPGDGKITINEFDGKKVGEFTVNQDGPTVITLPEILIPESLHPSGFIDVSQPAPADPEHGDIYIQHRIDLADAVAVASFVGIAGRTVTDGQFVMFGVDDLWHAGGDSMPTEHQADWAETDPNALEYIKNKPDLQAEVDKYAGDGAINVDAGPGIEATGPNATANQKTGTTRVLSVKTGNGIEIDSNGNVIIDPNFNLDGNVTAPNDGVLTVKDHAGATVGTFTANQAGNTDVTLPEGFSGDYNDLTNAPEVNNAAMSFLNPKGIALKQFTANQKTNESIYVYMKDNYIQHLTELP